MRPPSLPRAVAVAYGMDVQELLSDSHLDRLAAQVATCRAHGDHPQEANWAHALGVALGGVQRDPRPEEPANALSELTSAIDRAVVRVLEDEQVDKRPTGRGAIRPRGSW